MVRRLPSCAQPSPFFLPRLREEISILIVIVPIKISFLGVIFLISFLLAYLFFPQRKGKWVRASARYCPGVSAGTVRGGRRHLAVDIHALCLPQTRASEMKESNLKLIFVYVKYPFDILETSSRYDIIITVITKIDFKEITL